MPEVRGLKTQEGDRFERFFSVVQEKASSVGAVFFLFAGEGHELETEEMEIMDLSGWLIPESEAQKFETEWKQSKRQSELEKWVDFFTFAKWSVIEGAVSVTFTEI